MMSPMTQPNHTGGIAPDQRFSDLIRKACRVSSTNQTEMAELLGICRASMSDRLRGRSRWTLTEAVTLAVHFELDLDELTFWAGV